MHIGFAVLVIFLLWLFAPDERPAPRPENQRGTPPPEPRNPDDELIDPEYAQTELGQHELICRRAARARRLDPREQNW